MKEVMENGNSQLGHKKRNKWCFAVQWTAARAPSRVSTIPLVQFFAEAPHQTDVTLKPV